MARTGAAGGGWPLAPEVEERDYCRSFLGEADLSQLRADLARDGPLPLAGARALIAQNTSKESQESRGETLVADAELLMLLDVRIDYPLFFDGDNVYSREELYENFALEALGHPPESLFAQQEVGEFPARGAAPEEPQREYVARDAGDPEEFATPEDLVARATRPGGCAVRAPLRTAKTKIFVARERWADFRLMARFARGFREFVAPRLADAPGGGMAALAPFLGAFAAPAAFPALPAPPAQPAQPAEPAEAEELPSRAEGGPP
jgi:hypothetical protein